MVYSVPVLVVVDSLSTSCMSKGERDNVGGYDVVFIKRMNIANNVTTRWPSGLRRCVKAAVFGRGFESHSRQFFFSVL